MNHAAIARGWTELTDGFTFDSTFGSLMALLLALFIFAVCVDPGVRAAVDRFVAVIRAIFAVFVLPRMGRLLRSVLSGLAFGFFGFCFVVAVVVRILLLELADCLAALRSLDLLNSAKLTAALADADALRLEKFELKTELTNLSEQARGPPADPRVITRRPFPFPSALRSSAPVHPCITQPTRLERRRQAKYANSGTQTLVSSTYTTTTQTRTVQVEAKRPKCVDGIVQTNVQHPEQTRTTVSSFSGVSSLSGILGIQSVSPSPAVQTVKVSSLSFSSIKAVHTIEPVPDPRPAFSFSLITAVHTIVPVSAPRPARSETRDAGVQVHRTEELVSRDALAGQAELHATDLAALEKRRASEIDFLKSQQAAAIARAKADHDAEIAALKTSHANELVSLRSSATNEIASRDSSAAALRAELETHKQTYAGMKTTMHEAYGRYDTMAARVSSQTSEIETLRIQVSAAQAAASSSSSADPAAVEQKMAQMQAEYKRSLEMKDRDIERVRAAGIERQNRLAADLKKAEAKAKKPELARARVAALEHQLKFGTSAGVGVGIGANKNSIALKEELETMKKQRDDWVFYSKANTEKLVACDGARQAAVARVGELERKCARLRRSLGPGARTIVAAPSVSAVAGKKRMASAEMSGGEGKRFRESSRAEPGMASLPVLRPSARLE